MRVVALEEGLSDFRDALEEAGFRVVGMSPEDLRLAQAVVVSGGDLNVMQQEDIKTGVPVLSAEGSSPAEIVDQLRARL